MVADEPERSRQRPPTPASPLNLVTTTIRFGGSGDHPMTTPSTKTVVEALLGSVPGVIDGLDPRSFGEYRARPPPRAARRKSRRFGSITTGPEAAAQPADGVEGPAPKVGCGRSSARTPGGGLRRSEVTGPQANVADAGPPVQPDGAGVRRFSCPFGSSAAARATSTSRSAHVTACASIARRALQSVGRRPGNGQAGRG